MTLKEFYNMLQKHDWYHVYSDELHVFQQGTRSWNKILRVVQAGGEEYKKLLVKYREAMFDENKPLPVLED